MLFVSDVSKPPTIFFLLINLLTLLYCVHFKGGWGGGVCSRRGRKLTTGRLRLNYVLSHFLNTFMYRHAHLSVWLCRRLQGISIFHRFLVPKPVHYIHILQQMGSFLPDPTPSYDGKPKMRGGTSTGGKNDSANFHNFSQSHKYLIKSHVTRHNGGNMAMMVKQRRGVQTCLLTHNVRLEMQMAKLAVTPPQLRAARLGAGG